MPFGLSAGAIAAIGAGVSAAGAVGGSLLQANATKNAASKANATQTAELDQSRADLAPYNTQGALATTDASNLLGLNGPDAATAAMGNFQTSPGYQFSLDQGLRAVDAGAAAKGMLRSGATLKAEQTFGTGLADQEFQQLLIIVSTIYQIWARTRPRRPARTRSRRDRVSPAPMSAAARWMRVFTETRRKESAPPPTRCSIIQPSRVGRVGPPAAVTTIRRYTATRREAPGRGHYKALAYISRCRDRLSPYVANFSDDRATASGLPIFSR